jgi:TP901 family phage tail tape measure protein
MADTPSSNGNGTTRKRIRLEVNSASPNLQGIRQTIGALSDLNAVMRKVNQQTAMLSRMSGLDMSSLGKRASDAAAAISKATGAMAANTDRAVAAIQKFRSLPPIPTGGKLYSESKAFKDAEAMQSDEWHRRSREFRAGSNKVRATTTKDKEGNESTSYQTEQSPGKVRDAENRKAQAERLRQLRLESKQLEAEAKAAKDLATQKEKMWQANAKRQELERARRNASTAAQVGDHEAATLQARAKRNQQLDKANAAAAQRVADERLQQAQKSNENRKRIEAIPAKERDAGILAQHKQDAELRRRQVQQEFEQAQQAYRESKAGIPKTKGASSSLQPGMLQQQIDAHRAYVAEMDRLTRHEGATEKQRAAFKKESNAATVKAIEAETKLNGARAAAPPISKTQQPQRSGFMSSLMGDQGRFLGRGLQGWTLGGMARNVVTVGGWMNAVSIWFTATRLMAYSYKRMEDIQLQTARLTQVFKGTGGSAKQLANDVLNLAAAEGRSTEEAMASAIAWSRLGLTRKQVGEATRVSLMAANVAEMSADEATQRMAAVMASYGLQVSQLDGVLGMLNQSSNTYRVTNKDLLDGLSRVSSVARQAGMSLAELSGLLAASVQKSGQTGANMANALKTVLTRMNRPDVKDFFGSRFKVDIDGTADSLRKVWEIYSKANGEQRQDIMLKIASATQANRFRTFMESYAESVMAAADALKHLDSAEIENARITNTAAAARKRVQSSWDYIVNSDKANSLAGGTMNMISGVLAGIGNISIPGTPSDKPQYQDKTKANPFAAWATVWNPFLYPLTKPSLGYSDKPISQTDKFNADARRINEAKSRSESHGKLSKFYKDVSKSFPGMQPDAQGTVIDAIKESVGTDVINQMRSGDMSGLLKKAADEAKSQVEEAKKEAAERTAAIRRLEIEKASTSDLEKQKTLNVQILELKNAQTAAMEKALDEAEDNVLKIERMAKAMANFKGAMEGIGGVVKSWGLSGLAAEIAAVEAQITALREQGDNEGDSNVQEKLNEELRDMQARLEYLSSKSARFFQRQSSDAGVTGAMAGFESDTQGVGETDAEKILAKRNWLQQEYDKLTKNGAMTQDQAIRASVIENQLRSTHLEINKRILENDQERKQVLIDSNKEFRKSIIGSGPGELLRKLAASRLSKNGMNAGSLFAMSGDAQRDAYQLRGGERAAELNQEAQTLKGEGKSIPELQTLFAGFDSFAEKIGRQLSNRFNTMRVDATNVEINGKGEKKGEEKKPETQPTPNIPQPYKQDFTKDERKIIARTKFNEDQANQPLFDKAIAWFGGTFGSVLPDKKSPGGRRYWGEGNGVTEKLASNKDYSGEGVAHIKDDFTFTEKPDEKLDGWRKLDGEERAKLMGLRGYSDQSDAARLTWWIKSGKIMPSQSSSRDEDAQSHQFANVPGASNIFSNVASIVSEFYGKDTSNIKPPRNVSVKKSLGYSGAYDWTQNRLTMDSGTFNALGNPKDIIHNQAKQAFAHELVHYFQDMMGGDYSDELTRGNFLPANISAYEQMKKKGVNSKYRWDKIPGGHGGDQTRKFTEDTADMIEQIFASRFGTSDKSPSGDSLSVASDAAAKSITALGSSAAIAAAQLSVFTAKLEAFNARPTITSAPTASLPPQSRRN